MVPVTTGDIAAESVTAAEIVAGSITADKIEAVLVLETTIATADPENGGARVEIRPDGVFLFDSSHDPLAGVICGE
jgi:hypothetical protein